MSPIALVVAVADNGVIGANGQIPWHVPEDMRRFKTLTMGLPCVMGRRTWGSLPRKPLPGRTNIVLTRDRHFAGAGAIVVHTLEDGFLRATEERPREIMVLGGSDIYAQALPRADRIYLTQIHGVFAGDADFTGINGKDWVEVAREEHRSASGLSFSFVTLERRGAAPA
jgi:dihydrofolate reductase